MFAAALAGTYIAVKGYALTAHARDAAALCRITLLGQPPFGTRLSHAAALEAGAPQPSLLFSTVEASFVWALATERLLA